jgi:peptidoglycan hydrolase CwlO-like protein
MEQIGNIENQIKQLRTGIMPNQETETEKPLKFEKSKAEIDVMSSAERIVYKAKLVQQRCRAKQNLESKPEHKNIKTWEKVIDVCNELFDYIIFLENAATKKG